MTHLPIVHSHPVQSSNYLNQQFIDVAKAFDVLMACLQTGHREFCESPAGSCDRLIASDRKWPTSGSQARRLVRKTRRLSGRSHDLYRGYFRVYRTCCGMTIITVRLTQAHSMFGRDNCTAAPSRNCIYMNSLSQYMGINC